MTPEQEVADLRQKLEAAEAKLAEFHLDVVSSHKPEHCLDYCRQKETALAAERAKTAEAVERQLQFLKDQRAAEARVAELDQMLEDAHDVGAKLMLDQMERALTSGGKFSDERANLFVSAEARNAKLVEAIKTHLDETNTSSPGIKAALTAAKASE